MDEGKTSDHPENPQQNCGFSIAGANGLHIIYLPVSSLVLLFYVSGP
jgi:hypothetical protein